MAGFNLIIDGNYLLYKSIHTIHKSGLLYSNLHDTIISSVETAAKLYKFDNIYFVSDLGTSWRKKMYPEYKAGRTKDSDIDWEFCMDTYEEIKDIFRNKRDDITVLESSSVEGDDIIYFLVRRNNGKYSSNIILSDDGDLKQLVESSFIDKQKYFINVMINDKFNNNFVYVPESLPTYKGKLLLESKEVDLFDESDDELYAEYQFLNSLTIQRIPKAVNNIESLITKILIGDKSDNIKSVYSKVGTTGKVSGLGEATADKLITKYKTDISSDIDISDMDKLFNTIAELVCEKYKIPLSDESTYNLIIKNLKFNNKLINLNEIPVSIIEKIEQVYGEDKILG